MSVFFKSQDEKQDKSGEERWKRKRNFRVPITGLVPYLTVTAAESNGWRVQLDFYRKSAGIDSFGLFSSWYGTFEAAEEAAKKIARKMKIKFDKEPYV